MTHSKLCVFTNGSQSAINSTVEASLLRAAGREESSSEQQDSGKASRKELSQPLLKGKTTVFWKQKLRVHAVCAQETFCKYIAYQNSLCKKHLEADFFSKSSNSHFLKDSLVNCMIDDLYLHKAVNLFF